MQLLQLRFYQIKRDLGLWFLFIIVTGLYFAFTFSEDQPLRGMALSGVLIVGIYSHHSNRRDLHFLKFYFHRPFLQVALNYQLLIVPVSVAFVFHQQWMNLLILHVAVGAVAFVRPRATTRGLLFISRFIPPEQFEWISGLRRHFYSVLVLFLISGLFSPVKLFGLMALFLLNSVLLSFYTISEPLSMLNPDFLAPKDFLRKKIRFLTRLTLLINAPLLFINSVFHPESAWFCVGFLVGTFLLCSTTVYIKYATYSPKEASTSSIDQLILFAGLLIPYLLPLSVYLFYSNRRKAIQLLQHYQNDSN